MALQPPPGQQPLDAPPAMGQSININPYLCQPQSKLFRFAFRAEGRRSPECPEIGFKTQSGTAPFGIKNEFYPLILSKSFRGEAATVNSPHSNRI